MCTIALHNVVPKEDMPLCTTYTHTHYLNVDLVTRKQPEIETNGQATLAQ